MLFFLSDQSLPRITFDSALLDVQTLLELFDKLTIEKKGRPYIKYEVLKRTAIIVLVTAWETFIEDVVEGVFEERVKKAKKATEVSRTFNSVAHFWLEEVRQGRKNVPDVASWTGSGWKDMLLQKCKIEIERFNTPNYSNIDELFKKYLDVTAAQAWKLRGYSAKQIQKKLDDLISYRGMLVHLSKGMLKETPSVPRERVVSDMKFIEGLVDSTERSLGIQPGMNAEN